MCGIFGVSEVPEAARLTYLGLYALQHRGQESAGIVAVDREGQATGPPRHGARVARTSPRPVMTRLAGDVAVGHTRYSTAGSIGPRQCPAAASRTTRAARCRVAHNGNLTNAAELRRELVDQGAIFTSSTDTECLVHLIARSERADRWKARSARPSSRAEGAYSPGDRCGRDALRRVDPHGFRPLVLGRLGDGVVVASETCALDLIGATIIRELQPGEFVRIVDGAGRRTLRAPAPAPVSRCVFELVYFARPDSTDLRRARSTRCAASSAASSPSSTRRPGPTSCSRPRQRQRDGARLHRGIRHQARVRADPQSLRRPHLHQSDAGAARGQGQDQVQPGARGHRGPVGGHGRRHPRARHHQQGTGADDPRGRRPRGAPPARLAADHRARATTASTRRPARS